MLAVLIGPEGAGAGPASIHRPRGGDPVRGGNGATSNFATIGVSWTLNGDSSG